MKRFAYAIAAAFVAMFMAASAAHANSARITRGDAEALFQAPFNGGSAIRIHGGDVLEGAPVQPGGLLRPFGAATPHFCTLDWLVIAAGYIDAFPVTEDAHAQAVAEFSAITTTLLLDGTPLVLDSTAVKAVDPASTEQAVGPGFLGFSFQQGEIFAPGALGVGAHTLQLTSPFMRRPRRSSSTRPTAAPAAELRQRTRHPGRSGRRLPAGVALPPSPCLCRSQARRRGSGARARPAPAWRSGRVEQDRRAGVTEGVQPRPGNARLARRRAERPLGRRGVGHSTVAREDGRVVARGRVRWRRVDVVRARAAAAT
jgi:hypothetical protein